jgi:hypothetical protein
MARNTSARELGVEQRTMQLAVRIGDPIAFAQRIERVALAGMQVARDPKGVDDARDMITEPAPRDAGQFGVEERLVERGVVDQDLGTGHEGQQRFGDLREPGFVAQPIVGDAMHGHRPLIDRPLGIHVEVERAAGAAAVDDLQATDLDDPVSILHRESGGLGIQDDLSQARLLMLHAESSMRARRYHGRIWTP